jgi:hypothetical protein
MNRLTGGLAGRGRPHSRDFPPPREARRRWDGAPLPAGLRPRLSPEWEHVTAWTQRLAPCAAARRAVRPRAADGVTKTVPHLLRLNGMGTNGAGGVVRECCGGRAFRQRQDVGARRGLTPPP